MECKRNVTLPVLIAITTCGLTGSEAAFALQCTGPDVHASELLNISAEKFVNSLPKHVHVLAPKVLLFAAADAPIFLQGWVAEIEADCVKVAGAVTVGSFLPTTQSSSGSAGLPGGKGALGPSCGHNGCKGGSGGNGSDGTRGTPGYRPIPLRLTFRSVMWNGTLKISNTGGLGGDGGQGGKGGPGGDGGKGEDRCSGSPGDGGAPGDGGFGGMGGPGAIGGDGGAISYNSELNKALASGQLTLEASGGGSGRPGLGGYGGACGIRGDGGSGGCGGGGGSPGHQNDCIDRSNQQGASGPDEGKGAKGLVYCYDCPE